MIYYVLQIIQSLDEDPAAQNRQLTLRLQQVAAALENKVTDLWPHRGGGAYQLCFPVKDLDQSERTDSSNVSRAGEQDWEEVLETEALIYFILFFSFLVPRG